MTDSNSACRVPPHSDEAERALLGSMLLNEQAISEAISVIGPAGEACFFSQRHAEIYRIVAQLYDQRIPLDGMIIKDALERSGNFDSWGGLPYLAELIGSVASWHRARHYAEIVFRKYLLREMIRTTWNISERCYADAGSTEDILDDAERELFNATCRRVRNDERTIDSLVSDMMVAFRDREDSTIEGLSTGWPELDALMCGMRPQELIVVAGRPSMGKTALLLNIIENVSVMGGRAPSILFSLEMSSSEIASRMLCSIGRVDSRRLRRGIPDQADCDRLEQAQAMMAGTRFVVDDTGGLSIVDLRARARIYKRRYGASIIFVDYLQLLTHRKAAKENRQQEVSEISRSLKAMAKELGVPVVVSAQLNRATEDQKGSVPRMSNLRESGAIEQDADVVLLLHRPNYYDQAAKGAAGDSDVIIDKNRNGPVGVCKLHFEPMFARFGLASQEAPYVCAVDQDPKKFTW